MNVQKHRKRLGLTQAKLAALLGVASNTVARWERGIRTPPPYLGSTLESLKAKSKKKTDAAQRNAKLPRKKKPQ